MEDPEVKKIELFAWVGRDEMAAPGQEGDIGIKQALVPAGCIPLVAIDQGKMSQDYIVRQLQMQANKFGKAIRLCRFAFVEEVITLEPQNEQKTV